jgi:hypothetical protein
MSFSVEKMKKY